MISTSLGIVSMHGMTSGWPIALPHTARMPMTDVTCVDGRKEQRNPIYSRDLTLSSCSSAASRQPLQGRAEDDQWRVTPVELGSARGQCQL